MNHPPKDRWTRRMAAVAIGGVAVWGRAFAQEIEGDGKPSAADAVPPLPDMALGPADAAITIIEYASAACPYCAEFHNSHFGALEAAYIRKGKIRYVLREYPHNDAALGAFMVARCAPGEKYFAYIKRFFATQDEWTKAPHDGLLAIAQAEGMDQNAFETCLKNEKLAKDILAGRNLARSLGVSETPTFFINGVLYEGEKSYEGLGAVIDRMLKR